MSERASDLRKIVIVYIAALVVAALGVYLSASLGYESPLVQLAVGDLAATLTVFAFSLRHDNTSVYDAYWSVLPIGLVSYLSWLGWAQNQAPLRLILVAVLVWAWGLRLTHNWARGWTGLDHEDWRYREIRAKVGKGYWPISFLGLHLFPTTLVFLGCLPLFAVALEPGRPLGWIDAVATVVTTGAVVIEGVADNQLRDYALHRKRPGETMTEGIWAWSRHPNYFGEAAFWWGLWLFAVAAVGIEPWWMASGAMAITLMFNFISISLIETRMLARRADYAAVQGRVSRLVPWFPRKR